MSAAPNAPLGGILSRWRKGAFGAFGRYIEQMAQSGVGKQGNKDNKNACPNKAQAQLRQGRQGIVFIG